MADTALHTLANLKSFLNFNDSDTSKDSFLNLIITSTDKYCKTYLKRDILETTYTNLELNGSGTEDLVLPQYQIVSITSLYDDINRAWGSDCLIDTDEYVTDLDYWIITLLDDNIFNKAIKNIKITYKAGYSSVPADLSLSCIFFSSHVFKLSDMGGGRFGKYSQQALDGSISYLDKKNIPDDVREVWDLYKRKDSILL